MKAPGPVEAIRYSGHAAAASGAVAAGNRRARTGTIVIGQDVVHGYNAPRLTSLLKNLGHEVKLD